MDFQDVIMEEFSTDDIECLNEGWFPITPFLAFASFKKSVFDKLNKNRFLQIFRKIKSGEPVRELKGAALSAKEKIRHDTGVSGENENSTVYKLTPQQVSVLSEITNKYGSKLLNEIYLFRRNVLAPYQVIKRLVKENKQVSMKDTYGLSYEDYKAALESGRKKLLRRKDYLDNTTGKTDKIQEINNTIESIQDSIKNLSSGKGELSDSILNKVYQELEVGDEELQGYTLAELKNITDEMARNYKSLSSYIDSEGEGVPPEDIINIIKRNIELRDGDTKDVEKSVKDLTIKNLKKGDVNIALAKYMLRKEIRSQIKSADVNSYKKMYLELLHSLIKKLNTRKKDYLQSAIGDKISVELTDKEKKVWGKLLTTKSDYSGNIEDYYQKITDTSLKDVKHIAKPDELLKAQQEIENEIKRFERKLAHVISPEDLTKLKKYRLINNLITVKEMRSPEALFKTPGEMKPVSTQDDEDNADETNDGDGDQEESISENEFVRKIKELSTADFNTINELNKAHKELDVLIEKMKAQDDEEIVIKYKDIIAKIKERKEVVTDSEKPENKYVNEVIDLEEIDKKAREILKKTYETKEEKRDAKVEFDALVEKFKKEEPMAEEQLKEINFLLTQVERKLSDTE